MQLMKIEELIPHPRNSEFFDDMSGDKWKEFLESIKTSGVIEPIVITQDKVIVSGHQRVRACKELGITEIMTEVKVYDDEDAILKDLLETNIRQRGTIGGSEVKLGRRIKEMERIYGIRNGRPSKTSNNVGVKNITQEDLLNQLGLNKETYRQAKSLSTLPPEIQELVEQGKISASTGSRLIARLPLEEQIELAQSLPTIVTEKLTQKQVQEYADKLREQEAQIKSYKSKVEEAESLRQRIRALQESIAAMEQREPEVKTVVQTVVPDDYESLKSSNKILRSDNARMARECNDRCKELFELKDRLRAVEEDSTRASIEKELERDCNLFCARCDDFIKKVGGYAYLSDKLDSLPDKERRSYIKCVQMINAWAENIILNSNAE